MTIVQGDLKYFKSETVSTDSSNGGLPSEEEAVTGTKNNVWTNVSAADRTSGITTYMKLFGIPRSDSSDDLVDPKIFNHGATPGDDYIILIPGTKTDTQGTLVETTFHSTGALKTDIAAGVTSCTVTVENAAQTAGFHASGKIRISNQTDPSTSGDYETITLNATAPTVSGLDVTVYWDTASTNAYLAANTVVSSVYEPGTSSVSYGSIVVTSTSGTVDDSTFPPILNNTGTMDESITVSFTAATTFTAAGSRSGSHGSGDTSTDFTMTHPTNGKVLCTLSAGFFTGTYAALDTVVIPTVGNSSPFWLKRVVPALSSNLTGDQNITAYLGES